MQNENHKEIFIQDHMDNEVISTIRRAEQVRFNGFVAGIYVTPEIAETLLKANTKNRHISNIVNHRYAQAMHAGHWRFNGEPIIFSDRGRLLDGQNRLKAVTKSGVSIPMLIVYGIDEENFKTMDLGSKRTTGQILGMLDHKDSNVLAAALRLVYIYIRIDNTMSLSGSDVIYNELLLELFERHSNIKDSVKKTKSVSYLCNRTIAAFCHFVFSLKDAQAADLFIRQLATGAELHAGHPALVLRNLFTQKPDIYPRKLIALFFKAWNHFRKGEKIKMLKWYENDIFPEVI